MVPNDDMETGPDSAGRCVPTDDEVATRLATLVARMQGCYGDSAVTREPLERIAGVRTRISPPNAASCHVTWIEMSDSELILTVAVMGRWELPRNLDGVKQIEDTVEAVAAGRVVQLFRWGRDSTVVTFSDGHSEISTWYRGLPIPLPGWQRFARRVNYLPWEPLPSH
jgi:hypothetical protein